MRKIFIVVLMLVMTFGLTACGGNNQTAGKADTGKKKITVWAWDPNYNVAAMKEAKAIYEKEHKDVDINVVNLAKADLEQKLQTNLASGTTKNLPDVVLIEDLNAKKYLTSYPNAFAPLNDKVNFSQFAEPVDFMTINNKTYGLPFGAAVSGLFYRSDYLEQAGFKESDLQNITWERYIEIGKVVLKKTGHQMLTQDPNDGGLIRMMLQSAGSWYFDKDGKIDIENNKVLKEAVKEYQELMNSGIAKKTNGWADFVKEFNNGDMATVPTGCWITPSITSESSQSGKWRVAPMPRLSMEGSVNATALGGSSWYVLSASPVKNEAIDFLASTFGGSSELYNTLLDKHGINSVYKPAFNTDAYKKSQAFFGGQKIYEDFSKWSDEVKSVNFGMNTWEADAVVMAEIGNVLKGKEYNKAMSDAQKQVQNQIQH